VRLDAGPPALFEEVTMQASQAAQYLALSTVFSPPLVDLSFNPARDLRVAEQKLGERTACPTLDAVT
jgi:hypothetical protein